MSETTVQAKRFAASSFEDLESHGESEGRSRLQVRRHFDIAAFGTNAYRAHEGGVDLIAEHDEVGPAANRHEELYVVVSGHATFTVDGEDVDAPTGTLVFVRDPAARRKAVAHEAGTTVLCVGGRPGEAFVVSPWEDMAEMWPPYRAKDYDRAIAILENVLERHPGNETALFNLACCESLAGRTDDALEHLRGALEHAPFRESAKTDSDFDPIREDPRFVDLVGEAA
jgi:hypothetical protein